MMAPEAADAASKKRVKEDDKKEKVKFSLCLHSGRWFDVRRGDAEQLCPRCCHLMAGAWGRPLKTDDLSNLRLD